MIQQKKFLSTITLILLLGATLLTTGCGSITNEVSAAAPNNSETKSVEDRVPVEVAPVEMGDISLIFNYTGTLQPQKRVNLVPKVAGEIEQLLVEAGDEVKKGDPIAIINDDVYAAQLKQAQAALTEANLNLQKMERGTRPEQLAAAKTALDIARAALLDVETIDDNERTTAAANLASAQAALRLAQYEYDNVAWAGQVGQLPQGLQLEQATNAYEASLAAYNLQTNPGDAQLAQLESGVVQAELNYTLAQTPFEPIDFEIIKAKIQQAEAAVEQAQLQLDYATIKAPFDGVIAELYVTEGDVVGQSLLGVIMSKETEVELNVEESRIEQVHKGQHVSLRVAAHPDVEFPAVVTNVAFAADSSTHTFVVTVTPLDEEGLLRSGMYADTTLLAEERENTPLVPITAVIYVDNQSLVYVVNEDGTVEQRMVTTGLSNTNQIEILSGVRVGETVVTNGQVNLEDGVKVEVMPAL
jgi:HlyD family secretion protein